MSSRLSFATITAPRLIVIAAVLHLCLAVGLFAAGRAGLAPKLIDRDGIMGSFAFDSYDYQRDATAAAGLLRSGNVTEWATAAQPLHTRIIAISFVPLSPLFGNSTLSAEPYNLICYLTILALVFALGRELGGQRAGVLATAIVALWPTFLLHTLQLLKDPLFVTAALAFVLCAVTLLSRTYRPAASAGVSVVAVLLVLLLALVRVSFVVLMIAVTLLTLLLLVVRQRRERRLLFWNMTPALAILLTGLLLLPFLGPHTIQRSKQSQIDQVGPLKSAGDTGEQVPALAKWIAPGNKFARRISSMRSRFAGSYSESGSLLDADEEFSQVSDLMRYLPRALEIGMWAPFPSMWVAAGKRVGNVGKIVSGLETFAVYILQLLAVWALVRDPRSLTLWFVVIVFVCGVTALGFVIPNVGAIYRFRYVFWILLVVAAMTALSALVVKPWQTVTAKRSLIALSLACLLGVVQGCASHALVNNRDPLAAHVAFTNSTGASFRAVYLSPSSAPGWQEDVLAGSRLNDGDKLQIAFDPNGNSSEWDLKVVGLDGRYAEWKKLKFDGVSEITLVLKLAPAPVVVAEVE